MPPTMRIAILDAQTPVPVVLAARGRFSDMFEAVLRKAASNLPDLAFTDLIFTKYDCVSGSLPSKDQLSSLDGLIITGSVASAYDSTPWVIDLKRFIHDVYTNHPTIKIFGTCFGHQIVAYALLPSPDIGVRLNPQGWELGVQAVSLTPSFHARFGPVKSNSAHPRQMRIQFVHVDHVDIKGGLPRGFENVGSSSQCACQGLYEPGRVLSFQGHLEFDRFVNGETLKTFGNQIWEKEVLEGALVMVDADDDSAWAATVVMRFFGEDGAVGCT